MKIETGDTQRFPLKEGEQLILDFRIKSRIALEFHKDAEGQMEVSISFLPPADETN